MMSEELFKGIMNEIINQDKFIDKAYDIGIDFIDNPYVAASDKITAYLLKAYFTEKGIDLITWWLYEDVEKEITINNTTIKVNTLDELWHYITIFYDIYLNGSI